MYLFIFRMFIYELFAWISCTTIVAGQFVFQPGNVILRNLVIDNNTGDVFVGGVNYIYKLNKNLTQLKNVSTPCLVEKCKPGETVNPNANQLLMIENLTGTPRLFACGTYKYGICITYDMNSFSYTVLDNTIGAVSNIQNYSSIALEDQSNNGILIASTRIGDSEQLPTDYTFTAYSGQFVCSGTVKPCIGKSKQILLTSESELKIYYILAVIVGKFRYFFNHNMKDGTNVARLCDKYQIGGDPEIKTYMEIPLRCVGKDGINYEQLVAAKVVRPDGELAEKFGSTGDDDDAVLIGVFQKSSISSQSALCTYTFKQINEFFWENIVKCFKSNTLPLSKYVKGSTCSVEVPAACSLNSRNQKMTGTIKYESEALVTCSDCGPISSMDTTSYRGNIIAFLGAKDGKLSKFVIYSNSSGRRYETSNTIPGSGILSAKFDRIGEGAYLLSPDKVLKIPVEECGNRTSCESCVKGGDPYCGWCTLHAT
ncbi:plexin-A1 isoform X1, partial [Paramuricea clavata]